MALNSWKRSVLYAIRNECMNGNHANVRQRSPACGLRGLVRKFAKTLRSLYASRCTSGYRWLRKYMTTNNVISYRYSSPIAGLERPRGFQEIEAPRFQDSRHTQVVRLSALRTGRLPPPPPPRKYSWYSFLLEAESTPGP